MDFTDLSYSVYRTFNGTKFRLAVEWDCEGVLSVIAQENRIEVGKLNGQYCESIKELWLADTIDCRGPETFLKIEKLHSDLGLFPFLYISGVEAEGRGRNIALLLLHEVKRAILKLNCEDIPVVCWCAYPEKPIDCTQANISRLICYYRKTGAINPCADRQIMLWDPGSILDAFVIELVDLGPERKGRARHRLSEKSRAGLHLIASGQPAALENINRRTYASLCRKGLGTRPIMNRHSRGSG